MVTLGEPFRAIKDTFRYRMLTQSSATAKRFIKPKRGSKKLPSVLSPGRPPYPAQLAKTTGGTQMRSGKDYRGHGYSAPGRTQIRRDLS